MTAEEAKEFFIDSEMSVLVHEKTHNKDKKRFSCYKTIKRGVLLRKMTLKRIKR